MSIESARLRQVFEAVLAAVDPELAVRSHLSNTDLLARLGPRTRWIAVGKAAAAMRRGALDVAIEQGFLPAAQWLVQPVSASPPDPPLPVEHGSWFAGEHPVPGARGAAAASALLEALRGTEDRAAGTLILLSGGASAMLPAPPAAVPLADKAAVTERLLRAGATIEQLNVVRRHLSRIKGGGLARAIVESAPRGLVEVLVLSDVVGDELATVASGPCVGDPTTFDDAVAVIDGLGVDVPVSVARYLRRGAAGLEADTPFPGDPLFDRVAHRIVAGNDTAVVAAVRALTAKLPESARIYDAVGVFDALGAAVPRSGEAREVARRLVTEAHRLWLEAPARSMAVAWGGETTVAVRGRGLGGRSQELALAAALELETIFVGSGAPEWSVLAAGTDGIDGPTTAAGGLLDRSRLAELRRLSDPWRALHDNDSHRALAAAGALVQTGPTGTNVADVAVVVIGPRS